ncbi:Alpha/Beta hydrolase protein [Dipodascopsis tothii]|uniref:Alpha/Beta hydrolase protein n=1 Tax=Dipodascopsis tothii TaxID=44089 RepID=UPI0034CF535C
MEQLPFIGKLPLAPADDHTEYAAGFTLRHVYHHGTEEHPRLHLRTDVAPDFTLASGERALQVSSKLQTVSRLSQRDPDFIESYLEYARTPKAINIDFDWTHEDMYVPNVTDKETVVSLAKMTADAYVELPTRNDWFDVGEPFNETAGFGWDSNGIRGHIFVDSTNSTVIIALKGTSAALFHSDGDTVSGDKANDNLLFSCCCARISYLWRTVCDCYTKSYTCSQSCLEDALFSEDKYYRATLDIYRNVTSLYPDANLWVAGHSLGGAMSSLLGRTYGLPTVAFEAPGELLASQRLHLPIPPVPANETTIWHFGNNADPVFMGVCNGPTSVCWLGGYAMETSCHSGLECIYDTVNDKGWHISISNHRIRPVVEMMEAYETVPKCEVPAPCQDCFDWKFE